MLLPALQEVSDIGCDVGIADTAADIQKLLPELFKDAVLEFDINKIDASAVTADWNSKVGRSPDHTSICMLTNTSPSRAIGRTRSGLYRGVHLI